MKLTINILTFFLILLLSISCKTERKNDEKDTSSNSKTDSSIVVKDDISGDMADFDLEIKGLDDPERRNWQNPKLVLNKLGNLKGKIVADVGSGTGYFTFPISKLADRVIAIDIEQKFLDYIEEIKLELPEEQADKIETRLTQEDYPNLTVEEVDVVLMVNVYYYLNNRVEYMRKIKSALKENGILVLVDFKKGDMPVGPVENKVSVNEATNELKQAGFIITEIDVESLQYQYIIKAR